ncbi:MAG: hypothetical protein HYZ49_19180 [Chloroflexi bacterium]|nr:hypothetical protein [Chloroflexota bacterium]
METSPLHIFFRILSYRYTLYGAVGFGVGLALFMSPWSLAFPTDNVFVERATRAMSLLIACGIGGVALGYATHIRQNVKTYALASMLGGCGSIAASFFSSTFTDQYLFLAFIDFLQPALLGLSIGAALGAIQRKPAVWQLAIAGAAGFPIGAWLFMFYMHQLRESIPVTEAASSIVWLNMLGGVIVGAIGGGCLGAALNMHHDEQKLMGHQL